MNFEKLGKYFLMKKKNLLNDGIRSKFGQMRAKRTEQFGEHGLRPLVYGEEILDELGPLPYGSRPTQTWTR